MSPFTLRVLAAFMTAVMAVSLGPCPQVFADKKKFAPEAASFTSYELVTYEGGTIKIGIEDMSFFVETEAASIFEIALCTADDNNVIRRFKRQKGNFSIDFDGYLNRGRLYYVLVSYQIGSTVFSNNDNYIFLGDDGKIHFYKSPTYDFNIERCKELRDDKEIGRAHV